MTWFQYLQNRNVKAFVCVPPELQKKPVEGFSAGLVDDDDIYRWEVLIMGPADTF